MGPFMCSSSWILRTLPLFFVLLEFCGAVQISAILAFMIFCVSVIGLCGYWAISFPTPPEALQLLISFRSFPNWGHPFLGRII